MYEFDCPDAINVIVRVPGGAIEMVSEERSTASIEVAPFDNSPASQEAAAQTRVEMHDRTLFVDAPRSGGWLLRRPPRIRLTARLPLDSRLTVKTASADVNCHGRYASAAIATASGDVRIEHVTGELNANGASGGFTVDRADGAVRYGTASGRLRLGSATGDVAATSASGDISILEAGGSVTVKTTSGAVRLGTAGTGTTRVNAVSGDVSIGVAAGTAVWLDLTTLSGTTYSDLDVGSPGPDVRPSLTLHVRTVSGDIDVHRVQPAAAA